MPFVKIIIKNILRRKTRSILTIFGISIGIAAIVALVAISNGFVEGWTQVLSFRNTDITVVKANSPSVAFSSIKSTYGDKIKSIEGVTEISGILADIVSLENRPATEIDGYNPNEYAFSIYKIIEGKHFSEGNEIIMGKILAKNLNKKAGDQVSIETDIFRIVGIYETENIFLDGAAVMHINRLQRLMKRNGQVTIFELRIADKANPEEIKKKIETAFPHLTAYPASDVAKSDEGVKTAQAFSWATSIIALIVGVVGTMNTMIMSVFERTREIGVLRALGWRRRKIMRMVIGEALLLSLTGGIFGVLFGVLIELFLERLSLFEGLITGAFSTTLFTLAIGIAVSVGAFGGVYPAYRASKLSPIAALRYE